ncbi:hypothetical protein J6590_020711 [Homalodisca vitripennis]|nr:hypothetical protein J6590_020711 [Homalodisca vitripennis]
MRTLPKIRSRTEYICRSVYEDSRTIPKFTTAQSRPGMSNLIRMSGGRLLTGLSILFIVRLQFLFQQCPVQTPHERTWMDSAKKTALDFMFCLPCCSPCSHMSSAYITNYSHR